MSMNPVSGHMQSTEVLLRNLQRVETNRQEDMQSVMSGSFDTVSLSFLGREFNDYYQVLQQEGDEQALEGLRQMAIHLVQNPNSQQAAEFMHSMGAVREDNPEAMVNFFQGVEEIQSGSHDLGQWFSTYLRIDASAQQDRFVSTSRDIVGLEGEEQDVDAAFRDYLDLVNTIADRFEEGEVEEQLGSFFDRFDEPGNLQEHRETLDNYRTEMEWD